MRKTEDGLKVVNRVSMVIKMAARHGLENEVIAAAMIFLKENPKASVEEALRMGLKEWDL